LLICISTPVQVALLAVFARRVGAQATHYLGIIPSSGIIAVAILVVVGDAWVVIAVTALLWAIVHVQYNLFVMGQVFVFGLLLRWSLSKTGSAILTIILHAGANGEGMLETFMASQS
jgi:membrane protease YdiL (CAAX protease family)